MNKYASKAKELFGTSNDMYDLSYILPDGEYLPLVLSHGNIAHDVLHEVEGEKLHPETDGCDEFDPSRPEGLSVEDCLDDRHVEDIGDFLRKSGAIRISGLEGVDVITQPTADQLKSLKEIFASETLTLNGSKQYVDAIKRALRMV